MFPFLPPSPVQPKILVIRGGAIGDFLLTLPAIALLREAFPAARLEILGYEHIIALATSGGYADATRSIEYAALANFFNPKAPALDQELSEYFGGFQQIVSFLYDPDGFFAGNLRRCGVKNLIEASPKIDPEGDHAIRQLSRPLESMALYLEEADAHLPLGEAENRFADEFLRERGMAKTADAAPGTISRLLLAIHPGSGGERKNWQPERWLALAEWLLGLKLPEGRPRLLVIGGEADEKILKTFHRRWPAGRGGDGEPVLYAENFPLPCVGALPVVRRPRQRHFAPRGGGGRKRRAAVRADGPGYLGTTTRGDPGVARERFDDGRHHFGGRAESREQPFARILRCAARFVAVVLILPRTVPVLE